MDVENNIRVVAQEEGISIEQLNHLSDCLKLIKFESGRYELVDKKNNKPIYYVENTDLFYKKEDPYADFVFNESQKVLEDKHFKK